MTKQFNPNTIPPITDPMGAHWDQPLAASILIDDTHALMWESDFKQLANYSMSVPTGVYEGKMWKVNNPPGSENWLLAWFGPSDPNGVHNGVSINYRKILTVPVPTTKEFREPMLVTIQARKAV